MRITNPHEQQEMSMTVESTSHALVGTWEAQLTFTKGPRQGEQERLTLTFLPDGVVVGAAFMRAERGQLPPASGEWTMDGDRISYWLNAVLNDPTGRPATVVHAHGRGTLAADGDALTVSGGSEFYETGELVVTNRADLVATRTGAQ
jgi:hypothetical protein